MPFHEHLRLSLIGDMPAGEMFTCNLSMIVENSPLGTALATVLDQMAAGTFDDIVNDCTAFWARPASGISGLTLLKRVKIAPIGEDGKYTGPPVEAAVNVAGGMAGVEHFPNQLARKVTLETDGDLGRIKGGFYLPGLTNSGFVVETHLYSVASTQGVADSVKTFIEGLENSPGIDTFGFRVVIASQGRHNSNGTVRVAGGNHDVKRVNVGRRPDVQRRRANKISETRLADTVLASS